MIATDPTKSVIAERWSDTRRRWEQIDSDPFAAVSDPEEPLVSLIERAEWACYVWLNELESGATEGAEFRVRVVDIDSGAIVAERETK